MQENVVSHITKFSTPLESAMLIQALKSCGFCDTIQLLNDGILISPNSLKQISDLNVHLQAIRDASKEAKKPKRKTYPISLDQEGKAHINLVSTKNNRSFISRVIDNFFDLLLFIFIAY